METKYHEQFIRFGLKVQYYRKLRGMTQETVCGSDRQVVVVCRKNRKPHTLIRGINGNHIYHCRCTEYTCFKAF